MRITASYLAERGARKDMRNVFARAFPDGFEVTAEALRAAMESGIDIGWFEGLVPKDRLELFYAKARPAMISFHVDTAPACVARERAIDDAKEAFFAAERAAADAYRAATKPERDKYNDAIIDVLVAVFADPDGQEVKL
jgi:hypothetical protein